MSSPPISQPPSPAFKEDQIPIGSVANLQEFRKLFQLGLIVREGKGPAEVIVIDSIDAVATPN